MRKHLEHLECDTSHHEHEESIRGVLEGVEGIDLTVIDEARRIGVPWKLIFTVIAASGPASMLVLSALAEAIMHEPPTPIEEKKPKPHPHSRK